MSRVFESELPAMEKFVLLAMADHARDDGSGCYPSVATLARKTSLSDRGVQKLIRRLESRGLLAAKGKSRGGRGLTVEYDITLEKGEQRSGFRNGKGEQQCAKRVNGSAEKGERGSPESSRTLEPEPVAARIDRAKYIEGGALPVEKPVQLPVLFDRTGRKKTRDTPPWVKDELTGDLYRGIHNRKVAAAFFDARHLTSREQLAACVSVAVTTVVTSRVARLKVLSADEIERRAVEELLLGWATLEFVKDFEARRRQTVQAVTRVVIGVCVRMLGHPRRKDEA
jgi:hypothetical protein